MAPMVFFQESQDGIEAEMFFYHVGLFSVCVVGCFCVVCGNGFSYSAGLFCAKVAF